MAINLNIVRPSTRVEKALSEGYLYKDIRFDLNFNQVIGKELHRSSDTGDLAVAYDAAAIITSLKNILTTSPGEKLLNPTFGIDLRDFLFDPVTEVYAFFIGQKILFGLTEQEPRVIVDAIDIVANPDDMQYEITIDISIPSLNVYRISLKGVLNNNGYTFI
jgi:phage baseplate assembly protein W